jgi:DNA-binding MarR family transcriptional regulator
VPVRKHELLRDLLREVAILDDAVRHVLGRHLPDGVPEAQFAMLNHLRFTRNAAETPADLARVFRVSPPAMTQLLGRMVRGGLVRLAPDAADRRRRHVELTETGRALHERALQALEGDLARLARGLRSAELTTLRDDLRRLRHDAEAIADGPPLPSGSTRPSGERP